MSELLISTDSLQARKEELELHLIEGETYLAEHRKADIRRELGRITFELDARVGDE